MTFTAQHDAPPYDPAYDSGPATSSSTEAFDVDAHVEAGILANLFNSPDDLNAVRDLITEDDFLEPRHAVTFAAMCAVVDNGKALTPTLVAQHLRAQNLLNAAGGTEALALLIDPQEASLYDAPADVFAEILRDNSLRRSLEGVGRELIRDAGVSSTTLAQDALSNAQSRLVEAQNRFAVGQNAEGDDRSALMQMMLDLESHARTDEGISTGIPALTEALNGGWKDRSLNVLAARPGVGKSMLACDFAREAAVTQGLRVLFFSLEMTRKELQVRLVSAQSQIPSKLIARNNVPDRDLPVVRTAIESIADAPYASLTTPL
ncbi:hypothetical protein GCM10025873_22930 [Demequina sediminis]|nr:hypothetical protein GCM10025873_22930 [Demequina sediminis]